MFHLKTSIEFDSVQLIMWCCVVLNTWVATQVHNVELATLNCSLVSLAVCEDLIHRCSQAKPIVVRMKLESSVHAFNQKASFNSPS